MALLIAAPLLGYDYLGDTLQTREAYSGTVERIYSEKGVLSRSHSSRRHFWDVRTASGEVKSVRVRPRSYWSAAARGDWVIKRAGEPYPELIGRH